MAKYDKYNRIIPLEETFYTKYCSCIPLNNCLQIWSALKLIGNLCFECLLLKVVLSTGRFGSFQLDHFSVIHVFIGVMGLVVVESILMVALIVGLYIKNIRILKLFYNYSFYIVIFIDVCIFPFIVFLFIDFWSIGIGNITMLFIGSGILYFILTACVIFALKGEITKLRDREQFEFDKISSLSQVKLDQEEEITTGPSQVDAMDDNNENDN